MHVFYLSFFIFYFRRIFSSLIFCCWRLFEIPVLSNAPNACVRYIDKWIFMMESGWINFIRISIAKISFHHFFFHSITARGSAELWFWFFFSLTAANHTFTCHIIQTLVLINLLFGSRFLCDLHATMSFDRSMTETCKKAAKNVRILWNWFGPNPIKMFTLFGIGFFLF